MKSWSKTLTTLGPVLCGGLLMGLAPAPVSAWPLAWFALVPLWVVLGGHRTAELDVLATQKHKFAPARFPACIGFVWGVGYHGLALFWITGIHPMTWLGVPWLASLAIALFCWLWITTWGAIAVALWAGSLHLLTSVQRTAPGVKPVRLLPFWQRVLIGTALWCGIESLWGLTPLWWSSLSYTQSPVNLPILHLGQLSGPMTVTAAIVAVNGFLAEAWMQSGQTRHHPGIRQRRSLVSAGLAVGLLLSLHGLGYGLYSRPLEQPLAQALQVGVIQGNVPNEIKLEPAGFQQAIEGYTDGYRTLAAAGVDAVLTPETALPFLWTNGNQLRSSFYQAIQSEGVTAWVGTYGLARGTNRTQSSLTNSLLTVTGDGTIFSRYDKVNLVPLGEYIPFEHVLGTLIDRLSPLNAHLVAGPSDQQFDTPFGRAIASICYDSAFTGHFRRQAAAGGQFILSASNNAHYSAAMPAQHHAQDVMRAIETDRWTARATNTGYSAVVDAHGNTRWLSSLNTYALHTETIYRRQTQTPYVRWGNWLTPLLLVLSGFFVFRHRCAEGEKHTSLLS